MLIPQKQVREVHEEVNRGRYISGGNLGGRIKKIIMINFIH